MTDPNKQYLTEFELRLCTEVVSGNDFRELASAQIMALNQELERLRAALTAAGLGDQAAPPADAHPAIARGYVSRMSAAPQAEPTPEGAMQPAAPPPAAGTVKLSEVA